MTDRYEMLVEQNAEVPMRDGAILRANVYRPDADARFPVLMTFGPYGKDVPLREFLQEAWDREPDLPGNIVRFVLQAPRLRAP
jgi:predicted acyl esterase